MEGGVFHEEDFHKEIEEHQGIPHEQARRGGFVVVDCWVVRTGALIEGLHLDVQNRFPGLGEFNSQGIEEEPDGVPLMEHGEPLSAFGLEGNAGFIGVEPLRVEDEAISVAAEEGAQVVLGLWCIVDERGGHVGGGEVIEDGAVEGGVVAQGSVQGTEPGEGLIEVGFEQVRGVEGGLEAVDMGLSEEEGMLEVDLVDEDGAPGFFDGFEDEQVAEVPGCACGHRRFKGAIEAPGDGFCEVVGQDIGTIEAEYAEVREEGLAWGIVEPFLKGEEVVRGGGSGVEDGGRKGLEGIHEVTGGAEGGMDAAVGVGGRGGFGEAKEGLDGGGEVREEAVDEPG